MSEQPCAAWRPRNIIDTTRPPEAYSRADAYRKGRPELAPEWGGGRANDKCSGTRLFNPRGREPMASGLVEVVLMRSGRRSEKITLWSGTTVRYAGRRGVC